jgi:hypothetical protein
MLSLSERILAPSRSLLGDAIGKATAELEPRRVQRHAPPAPTTWREWLRELFPKHVRYDFGEHHAEAWEWAWAIELDSTPAPFIGVWAREGGKSSTAELITAALGVRGRRRYGLYLRETQDRADDSVSNIAALLEAPSIDMYYPDHGRRLVGKFGSSRGWRRNRLRTDGGFTVDALGLDTASRGAKVEDQRPDFIIVDDVDGKHDNAGATEKKLATLTTSILPAGSETAGVLGIQNLIISDGIFTRLVDGRADFLTDRIVSGPHPALEAFKYEIREDPETSTRHAVITAGTPTWEGQSVAKCQRLINRIGIRAFELECQHEVFGRAEGLALNFDEREHYIDLTAAELTHLVGLGQVFGGVDFGSWRFMFLAYAVDTKGRVIRIAEVFSQREEHAVRARRIHEQCVQLGIIKGDQLAIARFPVWADSAGAQDIIELNAAFARGWTDPVSGRHVTSPLRVVAVGKDHGLLKASIERINDKLGAGALLFARTVAANDRWLEGWNASHAGTEQVGSRLIWEMRKWRYETPQPGKAQEQLPSDHSADGADGIAAQRYALMSWWKPGKEPEDAGEELSAFSQQQLATDAHRSRTLLHRMKKKQGRGRRSRSLTDYGDD